jgi:biopolymer transport protein ExbD
MAFGGLEPKGDRNGPMAEINMTPLIDVMLVLLVIFIITAPLLTHAIKLDLPRAASQPAPPAPHTIELAVDAAGKLFWDGQPIDTAQMRARFAAAGRAAQNGAAAPEIHLRADQATRYQTIADVMSAAQQAGLSRIGFVMQPPQPRAQ